MHLGSNVCIHSFIHSFIHARFGGIQMDAADERKKERSAKEEEEALEKSTLRVVQRELESVPSSTKAANGKVKSTTTPLQKSLFCLVVSSFCIRAPPRKTGTRETHFAARSSALRLFSSFRRCINEEATSFISPRKRNC